jgi:hypothetical protein
MELHAVPSHSPRLVKTQALSDMDNVEGAAACIFKRFAAFGPWMGHTHSELRQYTQGVRIDGGGH